MSNSWFDDDPESEDFVAPDFQGIIMKAQFAELEEVDRQRELERTRAQELRKASEPKARTLMQIIGARTQKELEREFDVKMDAEERKAEEAEQQRKREEEQRLVSRFPAPIITSK